MEKEVVTRNEVREMGINVSNTQFLRYEEAGLLRPLKVGQYRSAVVRYSVEEVRALFLFRKKP
jgi:hypothetical protein